MSVVWKYFEVKSSDSSKVVCLLCYPGGEGSAEGMKCLSRGTNSKSFSTKPLWNHLRCMHPTHFQDASLRSSVKSASKLFHTTNNNNNNSSISPFRPSSLSCDQMEQQQQSSSSPSSVSSSLARDSPAFSFPHLFPFPAFRSPPPPPPPPHPRPSSFACEDRKHEGGGSHSGNLTSYPPGISENSRSSGENQGACDDVSVPVSPEQFLSEEMDQGGSPHTPSQRPESYKLRHNNHLMLVLESLAGDESFMDVTLTAQGKAIKAHKSVLSAVSPYFRSVLKENPCQHPIIIMPRDIRFEELNNIISYIYKGEMTVAAEDLSSLLKTAEILQVTGLSPSDSGAGAGGIMSQMQGLPSALFSNSTSKKSSKQKPPPPPPPSLQQSGDDASSDQQGRIDPLEFLNTDLSCVKEEVQSDNEDGGDESRFQPPLDMGRSNNSSEGSTNAPSEYPNASPVRNRSVDESSNKSEELSNKHFNPGESPPESGETPSDASPSSSTPHLCPFCSETHRPLDALQTHLRLKHPSKAAFVCSCGRVFHRISLLTEHSKKCKV